MGSELKFSTSYHPQTDSQMERVNALLKQFAYNLQQSSSTEKTPFELVLGVQPMVPADVTFRVTGECPAAARMARDRQEMLEEARDSLGHAVRHIEHYAN